MKHSDQKPKLVIFDLDGTILNLPINYDKVRNELKTVFKSFGVEMEFKPILPSIDTALSTLKSDYGIQKFDEISTIVYRVIEKYEIEAAKEAKPIAGAEETLNKLKQLGIKMAIFSRNGRSGVVVSLKKTKLEEYFDVIVAREDVRQQKPDAAGIETILKMIDMKSEEAIMVGDHIFDIMAARNAGLKSIAIRNEKTNSDEFKEVKPYAIANSISEILDIIDSWD